MREFSANVCVGLACVLTIAAGGVAIACALTWWPWTLAGVVVLVFTHWLGRSVRAK